MGIDGDYDEKEGGTLLEICDSFWDVPFGDETTTMSASMPNSYTVNTSAQHTSIPAGNDRSAPKNVLDVNQIMDWILGRHVIEDPTNVAGLPGSGFERDIDAHDCLEIGDVQDICPACTTSYCQAVDLSPFKSSLKLIYNDPSSQKWLVGNRYILHEVVDDHPEDEHVPVAEAARALRILAPGVPIPNVRAGWKQNGKIISISDNVTGERLYDIWWALSDGEREDIARQVAGYITEWRESDLGRISNFAAGPVYEHDNLFNTPAPDEGFGPFDSDLDLWRGVERRLRSADAVDEDTIQLLREYMPPSSPCVFTHGDLSSRNIIVHDETKEVMAIQGFEHAASLPAWAEDVAMHFCYCKEDEQWKALLSRHTRARGRGYQAALDWWSLWTAVEDGVGRDGIGMDPVRLESLKDRCRRWKKTEIRREPFSSALGHEGGAEAGAGARRLGLDAGYGESDRNESHASAVIRQAIKSDVLFRGTRNYRYHDSELSDGSWGASTDDEAEAEQEQDSEEDEQGRLDQIQQQLLSLATSARGPHPPQAMRALSREHIGRKPPPKPLPLGSDSLPGKQRSAIPPIALRDSSPDTGSESSFEPLAPEPRHRSTSRGRSQPSEKPRPENKGLRPLSLPAFALSESAKSKFRSAIDEGGEGETTGTTNEKIIVKALRSLSSIREDDFPDAIKDGAFAEAGKDAASSQPQRPDLGSKRTSMFRNRVAPGSLYAALSEARPRQDARSKSEERTRLANHGRDGDVSRGRPRPQSMLQPPTPSLHEDILGVDNGEENSARDGGLRNS
jgi:hypothetical protein